MRAKGLTDERTNGQTDGKADYYRAAADGGALIKRGVEQKRFNIIYVTYMADMCYISILSPGGKHEEVFC